MNRKQFALQRLNFVGITVLLSVLLLICPGFLRGISATLDFVVSQAAYFAVMYLLIAKQPQHRIAIVTTSVSTIISIYLLLCIVIGHLLLESLPNFISIIGGCLNAYAFYSVTTRRKRMLLILCAMCVCAWYVVWGANQWTRKINFGTFSGYTLEEAPVAWRAQVDTLSDGEAGKANSDVVVLDFFNTHCAPCFAKFPVLQKLHERYKSNGQVFISAVDIPYASDAPDRTIQMVRERGYTFPVLIGKNGLDSLFGIHIYPTVIVMTKNTIIFRGDVETAEDVVEEALSNIGKN